MSFDYFRYIKKLIFDILNFIELLLHYQSLFFHFHLLSEVLIACIQLIKRRFVSVLFARHSVFPHYSWKLKLKSN